MNHFFESLLQWSYDNGIFYINARDIGFFVVGVSFSLLIHLIYLSIKFRNEV